MTSPVLRLDKAGVCFTLRKGIFGRERKWAFRGLDMELYKGETLGVIGVNGVGKSTLLRLLAGVYLPSEGRIEVFAPLDISLLALRVGFVAHLSARENVILGGITLGMPKAEIKAKLNSVFEYAELEHVKDQVFSSFSTGMQARLAFAVAMCAEPDVLLIDEALAVGDVSFRRKSKQTLQERVNSDTTVVLVSHALPEIKQLCQRVLWLRPDKPALTGDTEPILEEYERTEGK